MIGAFGPIAVSTRSNHNLREHTESSHTHAGAGATRRRGGVYRVVDLDMSSQLRGRTIHHQLLTPSSPLPLRHGLGKLRRSLSVKRSIKWAPLTHSLTYAPRIYEDTHMCPPLQAASTPTPDRRVSLLSASIPPSPVQSHACAHHR